MSYKYSTQTNENNAKAVGVALPISTKQSYNVCKAIRGKKLQTAKKLLQEVIKQKKAIAYTKYNKDTGHKAGMSAGRYPIKTCKHVLSILESAEANAQFKGLSTANLIIKHTSAQQGPKIPRHGRNGGQTKRTHIEIVLETKQEAKK